MKRDTLKSTLEVLDIIGAGGYNTYKRYIELSNSIKYSREATSVHTPQQLAWTCTKNVDIYKQSLSNITVVNDTTQNATKKLCSESEFIAVLNFASATKPCGGFLTGAVAQEEDIARCSTLYACLKDQTEFYDINKQCGSKLYTDNILYSPRVPWFRTVANHKPSTLFFASIITAPAPNKNALSGDDIKKVDECIKYRTRYILATAKLHFHRDLVLGAWGCGVFGNNPDVVAKAFHSAINSKEFYDSFDNIVFAVLDKSKSMGTYQSFKNIFG